MKEVPVYKLELRSWRPPFADIFVHCSSGTYIRSLARDIALAAGSRGFLSSLLRTQIAGFELDNFQTDSITQKFQTTNPSSQSKVNSPLPINKDIISALGMPWFDVSEQEAQNIFHGKSLEFLLKKKPVISEKMQFSNCSLLTENCSLMSAAIFFGEALIAVVEKYDDKWNYECVLREG